MSEFEKDLFLTFLKEARQQAYVEAKSSFKQTSFPGFTCNAHDDGDSRLILLQAGLEKTSHIEIGYRKKMLVWNLTHQGNFRPNILGQYHRLIDLQQFMMGMLTFLRKAIGQPSSNLCVRGPESFTDQTMEYECFQSSETFPVTGVERIFYQEELVYQANFCAQWLRNC